MTSIFVSKSVPRRASVIALEEKPRMRIPLSVLLRADEAIR